MDITSATAKGIQAAAQTAGNTIPKVIIKSVTTLEPDSKLIEKSQEALESLGKAKVKMEPKTNLQEAQEWLSWQAGKIQTLDDRSGAPVKSCLESTTCYTLEEKYAAIEEAIQKLS